MTSRCNRKGNVRQLSGPSAWSAQGREEREIPAGAYPVETTPGTKCKASLARRTRSVAVDQGAAHVGPSIGQDAQQDAAQDASRSHHGRTLRRRLCRLRLIWNVYFGARVWGLGRSAGSLALGHMVAYNNQTRKAPQV
jgi:hypothetical protein